MSPVLLARHGSMNWLTARQVRRTVPSVVASRGGIMQERTWDITAPQPTPTTPQLSAPPWKRRPAQLAAVVLLAAAATGAWIAAQSGPAGPPADGGTYASAEAILAALSAAAAPCANPQPVTGPTLAGALTMTDCSGSSDGDTVVVTFDTHTHAVAYAQNTADGRGGLVTGPVAEVVGVNWAVNTVPDYGQKVHAALGGSILSANPRS